MPLTKTQQALYEEMKAALLNNTWKRIPGHGFTIRYTETHATPERIQEHWYPGETYDRHQFLTLTPTSAHYRGSVIYRDARAPWIEATDRQITYKLAFEILRNPAAQWA
jgi:hypothetical protein